MKADAKGAHPTARVAVTTKLEQTVASKRSLHMRLLKGAAIFLTLMILASSIQRYQAATVARSEAGICYAHLQQISAALMRYRQDHNGRLPRDLVPSPYIQEQKHSTLDTLNPKMFLCVLRMKTFERSNIPMHRAMNRLTHIL